VVRKEHEIREDILEQAKEIKDFSQRDLTVAEKYYLEMRKKRE